jgi:hypothetical protein
MSIKHYTSNNKLYLYFISSLFSYLVYILRLFYKNKSIEISCPDQSFESKSITNSDNSATDKSNLQITQDYLISDSLTGRYYTCYSLNKRNVFILVLFVWLKLSF